MGAVGGAGGASGLSGLPLVGGFFGSPADSAKQAQIANTQAMYGQYRPEMAQARMNAMRNQMGAYQGAMNALADMYGTRGSPSVHMGNPMGPTMTQVGQGASFDPEDATMGGRSFRTAPDSVSPLYRK